MHPDGVNFGASGFDVAFDGRIRTEYNKHCANIKTGFGMVKTRIISNMLKSLLKG
jgi:hypothetical protein